MEAVPRFLAGPLVGKAFLHLGNATSLCINCPSAQKIAGSPTYESSPHKQGVATSSRYRRHPTPWGGPKSYEIVKVSVAAGL